MHIEEIRSVGVVAVENEGDGGYEGPEFAE